MSIKRIFKIKHFLNIDVFYRTFYILIQKKIPRPPASPPPRHLSTHVLSHICEHCTVLQCAPFLDARLRDTEVGIYAWDSIWNQTYNHIYMYMWSIYVREISNQCIYLCICFYLFGLGVGYGVFKKTDPACRLRSEPYTLAVGVGFGLFADKIHESFSSGVIESILGVEFTSPSIVRVERFPE